MNPLLQPTACGSSYVSDAEAELYSCILRFQQVTREFLGTLAELEMSEEELDAGLRRLTELGLLRSHSTDPALLVPVDPDLAAAALTAPIQESLQERRRQLDQIHVEFGRLRAHFLEGRRFDTGSIEVIGHLDEVRAALNRASNECQEEVLSSQPGGGRAPEVLEEAISRDTALLARGVRMRTLYNHTARFNAPSQAYVAVMSGLGAEYRTVHDPFGRLIVFDRDLAFVPDREGSLGAVMVREPSLVRYLCSVFENAWAHARPFSDAAADGLESVAKELDGTILRLLAAGYKDEAIGRRLGMSLRTTRKHVADIMDTLGAVSRFQAGVLAARAGLLDHDESEDESKPGTGVREAAG
ncbi:helix-turn-helix transcriptional regulator [Streptomyces melanosporofaciens]|uniref:Regulatory protein, luxR family n=1 Tax=Streptomyces melanosporofaciens TaxID=67327 RepID=A0A1H5A3U9_STRMJ|nr:helix-turn-helix transcriptional regulator [Streptomyces melanosporofaciens]SED36927.1 regulatory protein, luxR family [Streptomyces melanosporofaciens]